MTPFTVLLTVALYVALLFTVAWRAGRRADNAAFFTGGRRIRWYWVALAMIGAPMSGVTFVSVPGSVAADSFTYMQMVAGFTIGQLIVAYVLVPTFYRLKVVSLYEYLDRRFGIRTHRTGAAFFLLSKTVLSALKLYVVCIVLQQLVCTPLGIPFAANAVLTVLFVWGYTRRGGVRSVVWTDVLQTLCLLAALVSALVAIPRALDTSLPALLGDVVRSPYARILVLDDPLSVRSFGKMFVAGIFILVAMTGLDQDMMQRNLSCPTARDSQRNILLTALCQAVVIQLLLMLGAMLYLYADAAGLTLPDKGDGVFAAVAVHGGLPLIVGILFVLGLVSSTYSTAGSALTALTTSSIYDFAHDVRRRDEKSLRQLRHRVHALLAVAIAALIFLFEYGAGDSVINLVYRVVGFTYGPILGLFAFGMATRIPIRERWVPAVCLLAPAASALLQEVLLRWTGYAIGFELILYNALFTIIGLLIIQKRNEK
ncbi:sodium:solute symporter [uncultured Alistipes sp.]|uniref:sodium:solute symporter n=1 Tax=uncultured Alistipes sp. TaxID=538949 RepID=UPI00262B0F76|nr:sodium:solute symporter [uncultured Alistipes sp.]